MWFKITKEVLDSQQIKTVESVNTLDNKKAKSILNMVFPNIPADVEVNKQEILAKQLGSDLVSVLSTWEDPDAIIEDWKKASSTNKKLVTKIVQRNIITDAQDREVFNILIKLLDKAIEKN